MKKKRPKTKKNQVLVKRVILHPGNIFSRSDGDGHFISASQLIMLYGVLPTDIVRKWEPHNFIPDDQKYDEGWIDLYPSYKGEYRNIHELDQFQIKNPTKISIADDLDFFPPNYINN